jgi:hypothetical protein
MNRAFRTHMFLVAYEVYSVTVQHIDYFTFLMAMNKPV